MLLRPSGAGCLTLAVALGLAMPSSLAEAQAVRGGARAVRLDIRSMPLLLAMERLSALTGVSIGGTSAIRPGVVSRSVRRAGSPAAALRRMLEGTGLLAIQVDPFTFRIVAARAPPTAKPDRRPPSPRAAPETPAADIVVVGTKLPQRLADTDANIELVAFRSPLGAADARGGAADLQAAVPSLSGTFLGRGRDKLFLRGIADSSFPGGVQATLGEYLGEARINYNAPDPGLLLYDVRRLELLKGPQGTLYGAGTLGGVLRIEPERARLDEVGGSVDVAASTTAHGGPGFSAAGMVNLPLLNGRAGVRLLGYRRRDGGYIDDAGRGSVDVNRGDVIGGRAQVGVRFGTWRMDMLATGQEVTSRDGNYVVATLGPLKRATRIAQPSRNAFGLLDLQLRGPLGNVDVVSTTSLVRNDLGFVFDATGAASATKTFREDREIGAFNHETRLTSPEGRALGWVVGVSMYAQDERVSQRVDEDPISDLNSRHDVQRFEAGAFAQALIRMGDLSANAGVRLSRAVVRTRTDVDVLNASTRRRDDLRASPTVDLGWTSGPTKLSLSYRESWRSGGAAVTRYPGDPFGNASGRYLTAFEPDHIRVAALAFSHRTEGVRPFSVQATLSGYDWDRIQSATLEDSGQVVTANGDSANLLNLDLAASWKPLPSIDLGGGASATRAFRDSFFDNDGSDAFGARGVVPSVPDISGFASAEWGAQIDTDIDLAVEGRVTYVGHSRLGLRRDDARRQGGVLNSKLAARITRGGYSATLEIDNVADVRSNLFGYGNPFAFRLEDQRTPPRPRTITLGLHAAF